MSKQYKNTVRPTHETRQAASPRDKHNAPSRPGALLRLVCALLVLTLCAAPLLYRYSSRVSLPVAHGEGDDYSHTTTADIVNLKAPASHTTTHNGIGSTETYNEITVQANAKLFIQDQSDIKMEPCYEIHSKYKNIFKFLLKMFFFVVQCSLSHIYYKWV